MKIQVFKKHRFAAIALASVIAIAAAFQIYNAIRGKAFSETAIFTHPEFDEYNLRLIRVTYIYDGDTVRLENGRDVRYLGIDTPEMDHSGEKNHEPLAAEATELNRNLCYGKTVLLVIPEKSEYSYDRLLAYIYAPSGDKYINVSARLLEEGLGDTKYGAPDPSLPPEIEASSLNR